MENVIICIVIDKVWSSETVPVFEILEVSLFPKLTPRCFLRLYARPLIKFAMRAILHKTIDTMGRKDCFVQHYGFAKLPFPVLVLVSFMTMIVN